MAKSMSHNDAQSEPATAGIEPIRTQGVLTVDEVLSAAWLAPSLGTKVAMIAFRISIVISVILAHGATLLVFYQEGFPAVNFVLALAVLLDTIVLSAGIHYWRLRRTLWQLHKERRLSFQKTVGRIDETGLYARAAGSEQSMNWRQFRGYRANAIVIILYQLYPTIYVIIGRSKFASETDWLRAVALVADKMPRL